MSGPSDKMIEEFVAEVSPALDALRKLPDLAEMDKEYATKQPRHLTDAECDGLMIEVSRPRKLEETRAVIRQWFAGVMCETGKA